MSYLAMIAMLSAPTLLGLAALRRTVAKQRAWASTRGKREASPPRA